MNIMNMEIVVEGLCLSMVIITVICPDLPGENHQRECLVGCICIPCGHSGMTCWPTRAAQVGGAACGTVVTFAFCFARTDALAERFYMAWDSHMKVSLNRGNPWTDSKVRSCPGAFSENLPILVEKVLVEKDRCV